MGMHALQTRHSKTKLSSPLGLLSMETARWLYTDKGRGKMVMDDIDDPVMETRKGKRQTITENTEGFQQFWRPLLPYSIPFSIFLDLMIPNEQSTTPRYHIFTSQYFKTSPVQSSLSILS